MDSTDKKFEERADFIDEQDLLKWTVENDFFNTIQKSIIGRGAKLIVGPRGTGKTHQLKHAYFECIKNGEKPLALYVTFGSYYHLEPLLFNASNAINIFHAWVLSKIILSCYEMLNILKKNNNVKLLYNEHLNEKELRSFIEKAERYKELPEFDKLIKFLSIQKTIDIIENLTQKIGRKRAILILDDAALTLTPDYMIEFFDIFRSLKTLHISPKASVYPGTTQYGPRFHIGQDAENILAWLKVDDESYSTFMDQMLERRFVDIQIEKDIIELLKFASFGIPRAFITLMRNYQKDKGKTIQQKFNNVINDQKELLQQEYLSLALKIPQYSSIIRTGLNLFDKIINELTKANQSNPDEKQVCVGIMEEPETHRVGRMIKFLIEAGFLYEIGPLHDGPDRMFNRYMPHFLFLIQNRAFSFTKGFNAKEIILFINKKTNKRPLRKQIKSFLDENQLNNIRLNLPACSKCGTERLTEGQKFCHNCGNPLIGQSAFEACLKLKIEDLPIPKWQKEAIIKETQIRIVEDILISQGPASELKKAHGIGKVKSNKIYEIVNKVYKNIYEEFLA